MAADAQLVPPPSSPLIPADGDFATKLVAAVDQNADMASRAGLRFYDYAVKQWFQGITVMAGQVVPMFKASPLRAFATFRQLLAGQHLNTFNGGKVDPARLVQDGQLQLDKFPLPFANFTRGAPLPRTAEQNQNYPVRNLAFLTDTKKRRTAYSRYPKPIDIPYQIDLWCRLENHMNYFLQKIYEQFDGPLAYWKCGTPLKPDPSFFMPIKFENITDNSDLETDQDRLLRQTVTLTVQGWFFFDVKQAPTFQVERDDYVVVPEKKDVGDPTKEEHVVTKFTDFSGGLAPELNSDQIAELPHEPPAQP